MLDSYIPFRNLSIIAIYIAYILTFTPLHMKHSPVVSLHPGCLHDVGLIADGVEHSVHPDTEMHGDRGEQDPETGWHGARPPTIEI
jgi:hypothetical protein